MRKFLPMSSAVAALFITSALSGCGGTSAEPVTALTTRTGGPQTSSATQTTASAAATAAAPSAAAAVKAAEVAAVARAAKTAEAAKVSQAKVSQAKIAAAAKAPAAQKAVTITKDNDPKSSPTAPLPTQPSATLRETCPKVAKVVTGLRGKSSYPTAPQLDAALAQVKLLNKAGDTETRNALSALLAALPAYRGEDPTGLPNAARAAFLNSLTNLSDRCEAVGSSALQWVG